MKFKTNFENFENLSSNSYSFNMNFLYTDRDKRFIKFYEEFLNLPPVSNENFDIYSNIVESTINVSFLNRLNFNLPPVSFTKENYDFSNSILKTTIEKPYTFKKKDTSLVDYVNQTDNLGFYNNLENITSIYHYSIPNTKLNYPEPFVASSSFIHSEMWYMHILTYQYWLWFAFTTLITVFFTLLLITLRWCNIRVRPKRETRGVSRAKCGDLITACVPVSWAASIIVSETTDAIDYYDGSGTTEFVVGIRAYQWGWEYYYPKDIDLNYNVKNNYSSFIGNSLKYNSTTGLNLSSNNFWKFYQNKASDQVITPAHLLILPSDNLKLLNLKSYKDIGASTIDESTAFKSIKMGSKTFNSNLVFTPSALQSRFTTISNLYQNEDVFLNSYLYGMKRQHNFLNNSALLNHSTTFYNLKSIDKFLNYNNKTDTSMFSNYNGDELFNFFKKNQTNVSDSNIFTKNKIITNVNPDSNLKMISFFSFYPNSFSFFNNDSDKKKLKFPIYKMFNNNLTQTNTVSDLLFRKNNLINDFSSINSEALNSSLKSKDLTYQSYETFSPNRTVLPGERSLTFFSEQSPTVLNYNYSTNINTVNNYMSFLNNNTVTSTESFFLNTAGSNWSDLTTLNKYTGSNAYFGYPRSPIISNEPQLSWLNYDKPLTPNGGDSSLILINDQKDTAVPAALASIYWDTFLSKSSDSLRVNDMLSKNANDNIFYLPLFTEYYDYDFRNWQALELLEDCYWETNYSIYNYEEYLNLVSNFSDTERFNKFDNYFQNLISRNTTKTKKGLINNAFFKDNQLTGNYYSSNFYLDESVTSPNLLTLNNFYTIPLFSLNLNLDDSYESFKNLNYFLNQSNSVSLNNLLNNNQFHSHTFYANTTRSDYEDFSWHTDKKNVSKNYLNLIDQMNGLKGNIDFTLLQDANYLNFVNYDNLDLINFNSSRVNILASVRPITRSSMVTYSAMQKVFRSRFEEGRSHAKLSDLANSFVKQPYLNAPRVNYEKLLGKDKISFYKTSMYQSKPLNYFNAFYDINSTLNFSFFDFPFLLSPKSDPARYLWFDWYAKWGDLSIQPSSSSKYAIHGLPYFNKIFEFSNSKNDVLNETENYLTRLLKARKNYLSNWTNSPYFYSRSSLWYKNNNLFNLFNNSDEKIIHLKGSLAWAKQYWTSKNIDNTFSNKFTSSLSNNSTYSKAFIQPALSSTNYNYTITTLIDILGKREYMYRELFIKLNKIVNLPSNFTANPKHPIINEIRAAFLYNDQIQNYNEGNNLTRFNNVLKTSIYRDIESYATKFTSSNWLFSSIFSNVYNDFFNEQSDKSNTLLKNQYRPVKKGISSMIRLHATGAMAMPVEMRVQILASSKDVIHSWSIPSAGIKIDCVPGYSSHRIAIFLATGIFWGQCMEICGRYHHWMPIVVYFMKRDLFFLWCTHFIFLPSANNDWAINDRSNTDFLKLASFDKSSWLAELVNI